MKKNYIIFHILTVLAYFYGIILCASLVGIPLGVYAIISAHRYSEFAEYSQFQLSQNKQRVKNWVYFGAVLYFPFGLIGLLCLTSINNNVSVEEVVSEPEKSPDESESEQKEKETVEVEIHTPSNDAEKAEKLAKLERFKQNGLITEEEFEQAKQQLYGDK